MKAKLGATNAYLGNTIGTCTPSRIVTVLFNTSLGIDIAAVAQRIQTEALAYASETIVPLRFINTSQRHKECRACANEDRRPTCPFQQSLSQRLAQPQRQESLHQHPQVPSEPRAAARSSTANSRQPRAPLLAAAGPPSVLKPTDTMCRSWRANKTCSRKGSKRLCSFDHPAGYVLPPDDCCRNFFRTGRCSYGSQCKFNHTSRRNNTRIAIAVLATQTFFFLFE
jgi:hypothetical protein